LGALLTNVRSTLRGDLDHDTELMMVALERDLQRELLMQAVNVND
jgi:hypothetical protein